MQLLYVGLGGFLGAISRWGISKGIQILLPLALLPWGTLVVNVLGSFALTWLMTAHYYRFHVSPQLLLFVGTGFMGAFTTFSTFSYETITLFSESVVRGLLNAALMLTACLAAALLGFLLARCV
jgi:CrcB protein